MLLGRVVNVQEMDSCGEFEGSDHSLMADPQETDSCEVWRVEGTNKQRKQQLLEIVDMADSLSPEQAEHLRIFLAGHNEAFNLELGERGETSLADR